MKPSVTRELLAEFVTRLPDNINMRRSPECSVYIVGVRGWSGPNSRGKYDDASFIVTPDGVTGWNFNTDPSVFRPQIATLLPGVYDYREDLHGKHHINDKNPRDVAALAWLRANPGKDHPDPAYRLTYWALVQDGPVTVLRDGNTTPETVTNRAKFPMINIHHGGLNGTSSEGCQTVILEQWQAFRATYRAALIKYKQKVIKYVLVTK